MTAVQLAGDRFAALLSEKLFLVSCLGIGSRTQAFQDPLDAWRTGYSLTAVMVLTALAAWVVNQLLRHFALSYFQTLAFAPDRASGGKPSLRYFLRTCIPELSRRMDENLASVTSNCAAMGTALLIASGVQPGGAFLYALFGGAGATVAMICASIKPTAGGQPDQLSPVLPGPAHQSDHRRADGPVPGRLLRPSPELNRK